MAKFSLTITLYWNLPTLLNNAQIDGHLPMSNAVKSVSEKDIPFTRYRSLNACVCNRGDYSGRPSAQGRVVVHCGSYFCSCVTDKTVAGRLTSQVEPLYIVV